MLRLPSARGVTPCSHGPTRGCWLSRHRRPALRAQALPGPPRTSESRSSEVSRQLEGLLPLRPGEHLAKLENSSAASPVDLLVAPDRLDHLQPVVAAVPAASLLDSGDKEDHHEQQHGGEMAQLVRGSLAKLGISLSDRAVGLVCMNMAVLFYSTNWVSPPAAVTGVASLAKLAPSTLCLR
jgi:hypothetical protein